ncbi:MAG: MutS2/Smr-associated SH3 domain-containing protein [Planctomycetota bacterium]
MMDTHALECLDFQRIRALLAEYALSELGRGLCININPITRPEMVQRWLNQVEELRHLNEDRGLPPFGGITNIRDIVRRCKPPLRVTVDEVARIGDTLAGTHVISRYFQELPADYPELGHLVARIGDFESICQRIRTVIDERGQVRDDASSKLQRLRREIELASAEIGTAIERLLRDAQVRRLLQYPNPTFHNDRIVLPVRTEYRGRLAGIIHRTSDSGATLYIEPAQAVELNNQISNLKLEEQEEINRLLWELAHEVNLNSTEIVRTLDTLAVLDLIIAKVRFARDFGLRCPQINTNGQCNVRNARHPLLIELARRSAVDGQEPFEVTPINYRLGDDFDMLIITGPNTGGKTVTLKTVGLLNLMIQAGIPIPVDAGSSINLFNNILIDVGDEQSMQQSLSTFSAHLKRLMEMMRRANNKTLVLIDELGAGTDPDEGAAIGKTILDELLRMETRCMVTTHLGTLKGYALTRPRVENASVEFDTQTLCPTYHLRVGESGSSNAIDIAQRLGMSKRLVAAARRNLSHRARALNAALRGTASAKRQAEQARQAAEHAQLEANTAHGHATAARERLERQQADFRTWVQQVVHLQPGDPVRVRNFDRDGRILRMRIDQQRAEVDVGTFAVEVPLGDVLPPQTPEPPPRPPRPVVPAAPAPQAVKRTPAQHTSTSKPRTSKPRQRAENATEPETPRSDPRQSLPPLTDEQANQLQPGDSVYVKRFHRNGQVVRIKSAKRHMIVSVGALEVEVPYEGLAIPAPHTTPRQSRASSSQTKKKAAAPPTTGETTMPESDPNTAN